jgi:PAS domain S-box-containing protein
MAYPVPDNEDERLRELARYNILDTPPEESFDRITRLAAELFDAPIALVSFIDRDRQWLKSCFGIDLRQTDREIAVCTHTILNEDVFVVGDLAADDRFADNPLVTGEQGLRFYAGAPLITPQGHAIGSLCVIDTEPRSFSEEQVRRLEDLAAMVINELELRREIQFRQRIESDLRESEVRFRGLVSNMPGIAYRCTYDGKWDTLYASGGWEEVCGHPSEPFVTNERSFKDIVVAEDLPKIRATVRRAVRDKRAFELEYRIRRADGRISWIHDLARPCFDEEGHVTWLDGVMFDVTERKQTEERLRLLETAVHEAKEAVLITDAALDRPGPRIIYVNEGFETMTGYAAEDVLGKTPRLLQGPETDRAVLDELRANLEEGKPFAGETINYHKDGTPFHLEWSISPVRDPDDGRVTHYVAVERDITERKEAEERMREALEKERELSNLKSRFVSMASHELRTPLATIQSSAELVDLFIDRGKTDKVSKHLYRIQDNVDKMASLLEDVLVFGRAEQGQLPFRPEEINLIPVSNELIDEIRQGIGAEHNLVVDGHHQPIFIEADEQLFRLVVNNLISNAIKYSPKGSQVAIQFERQNGSVLFHVTDEGIGIPEGDLDRLFEPFHRAENVGTTGGTGLGLAIVKEAAEVHGGSVTVDTEEGEGTQFTVRLPVRCAERATT